MLQLLGTINHSCCLATALLPNRNTASFESEAGPPYDKQRIQMGLRSGNTVLICFRSGVGHFQSVLIALTADLHTNKPWQGQHKFWKYVSPIRTYFAVDSSALTGCIPMGRVSARSSFMQRSSCYGSPLESRLFGVKTMRRLLYMRPSGRSSALKTDMYLLR